MTEQSEPDRWEYRPRQLIVVPGLDFEEWSELHGTLDQMRESSGFWLGDSVLYGQAAFGEMWAQAVDGRSINTVKQAMWVCSRIPPERRRESLSYTAHKHIAVLPPELQTEVMDIAERDKLGSREIAELVAQKNPKPYKPRKGSNNPPPEAIIPEPYTPEPFEMGPEDSARNLDPTLPDWLEDKAAPSPGGNVSAAAEKLRDLIAKTRAIAYAVAKNVGGVAAQQLSYEIARTLNVNLPRADRSPLNDESATTLIPPGWSVAISAEAGDAREWVVELKRAPDHLAVGIGPSLPCAIVEAGLSASLVDMGQC